MAEVTGMTPAKINGKVKWSKGSIKPADLPDIGNAPEGYIYVANSADATAWGLPVAAGGVIETFFVGAWPVQRFTTFGSIIRSFVRSKLSAGWTAWQVLGYDQTIKADINAAKWVRPVVNSTTLPSIDDAGEGIVKVLTSADATAWGLPRESLGIIETLPIAGNAALQWFHSYGTVIRLFWRVKTNNGWQPWNEFKGAGSGQVEVVKETILNTVREQLAPLSASGFKTVPCCLTLGTGGTPYNAPAAALYRVPLNFAAPVTRWRIGFTTRNPRTLDYSKGDVTMRNIVVGTHAGDGAFTSTPTSIAQNLTVTGDGAVTYTGWQTLQMGGGTGYLLGFDYQSVDTSNPPWLMVGGGWKQTSGAITDTAPAMQVQGFLPFDMWVELETYAGTPVIMVVGDSISSGVAATLPVHDSWLSQYCRAKKALPMHSASGGEVAYEWATQTTEYGQTRWSAYARPDAAIIALGSNDFYYGRTSAQMQADVKQAVTFLRATYTENVFAATVTARPAGSYTASEEQNRLDYNNWLRANRIDFRDVFDFDAAISAGSDAGLKPEYDGDGVHPNTAGYGAMAAAISRPVTTPPVQYATD